MTKFQLCTILTCHTIDSQANTIGKAIRPLFTDPVTYITAAGCAKSDFFFVTGTKLLSCSLPRLSGLFMLAA